jgi:hypothetical protein
MKSKSIFTFLFLAFLSFSCKNEEKKEIQEKQAATKPPFTVIIKMTAKEDDIMSLYYKDNTMCCITQEMAIYKEVKKGDQEIVFGLPDGFLPNDLRFDLSAKNPQQLCKVEKIQFLYDEKSFEVLNSDLEKYFLPNAGVIFDAKNRSYTFKEEDGNYDPFLNVTRDFYAQLAILVGNEAMQPAEK